MNSDGNADRDPIVSFDTLVDGSSSGIACEQPTIAGETAFAITAPTDTTELKITYGRPLYAPGWSIYRDGVLVVSEGSNRGSNPTPAPVTYSYTLQGTPHAL